MSTPISSNNPLGNIRQPNAAPARPIDTSAVDQTAAEFAALLGSDPPPEQPKKMDDDPSPRSERSESGDSVSESKAESRGGERITRKERRGESDGDETKDESAGEERELPTFGDAILEGFSKVAQSSPVEAPPTVDAPPAAGFDNVVQQICDKILVSDPGSGTREVRIMLKDSVLPGTEIRLVQEAGKLQVQFVTDNADSASKLAQHQATLQTLLNEKLSNHEVVVEVAMDSQSGQDMGGDGRSRQQRDAREEYERQENG